MTLHKDRKKHREVPYIYIHLNISILLYAFAKINHKSY